MSRRKQLKPVHLGDDEDDDEKPDLPNKKIKPATDDRGRDKDREDLQSPDEPVHPIGVTLDKLRTRTKKGSTEIKTLSRPYSTETTDVESPTLKKGKSTAGGISCQHCDRTFRTLRGLHTHERQHKKEVVDNNSEEESETTDEYTEQKEDVEMEDDEVTTIVANETNKMKDESSMQALDMSRSSCENYECLTFMPDPNNNVKHVTNDGKKEFIIDDNGNVSPYLASRTCQICGKFCAKPSDLKRHMLIHSGERPFPCEVCGKSFKAKGSMLYHQKAAHHMDVELSPGLEERYQRQKSRHSFSPRDRLDDKIPFCDLERPSDSVAHSYQLYRSVDENNHEVVTIGKPFPLNNNTHVFSKATDNLEVDLSLANMVGTLPKEGSYPPRPAFQAAQSSTFQHNTVLADQSSLLIDSAHESLTDTSETPDDPSSPTQLKLNKSRIGAFIQENKEMLKNHFKIKNETVIISRLDGIDLNTKEETTLYKCYLCGRMFKFMSRLQCHLSTHVECEIVTYQCPFCNVHFPYKSQLRPHIKQHLKTDEMTNVISDVIPQPESINTDNVGSENKGDNNDIKTDKILPTSTAGENTDSPSDKHEETTVYANNTTYRKVNRSYVCRFCRKGFFRLLSLQKHERLVHSQNVCKDCGKTFTDFSQLRSHIICVHNHKKDLAKKARKKAILACLLSSNRPAMSDFLYSKKLQKKRPEKKNYSADEEKTEDNQAIEKAKEILQKEGINEEITVVMPTDPLTDQEGCDKLDGEESQTGSETNVSETCSDNGDGDGIMTAPKRSLLSFCKDGQVAKSRRKCSQPVKIENNNNNTQININVKQESSPTKTSDVGDKTNVPNMTAASLATAAAMNHLSSVFLANALTASSPLPHVNTSASPLMLPSPVMSASAAMPAYPINQFMSVPITVQVPPDHALPLGKMSASSSGSSKSSSSPVDRDNLVGFPRVAWTPSSSADKHKEWKKWAATQTDYNSESTDDGGGKNVSLDSRKVTSLSRTHSRLHVINSPIDREKVCKPTPLPDGRVVYRCPFCHKDFVSFSDINRHMDFHEDIRPYKCKFCDYYARTNSQLKVHMMRHQGIREYCCKLCSYKGVTQSDLNRHMKSQIHLLKSQNECPHCGEGFVTEKNLSKHLSGNCIIKMYGKLRDSNSDSDKTVEAKDNKDIPLQNTDDAAHENNNNYLKDAYMVRYRESQLEQMRKEAVRAIEKVV